jgi:outer membrane receptor protein involved in Fe transport
MTVSLRRALSLVFAVTMLCAVMNASDRVISGTVIDQKGAVVVGATVEIVSPQLVSHPTDSNGRFAFSAPTEPIRLRITGDHLVTREIQLSTSQPFTDLKIAVEYVIAPVKESLVITATAVTPEFDTRNAAVYSSTLFNRDDQLFDTLASGINAGQHEGGGKSVEVRRFGFNLDHGGINGGLKVLVDDVQQNQSTQGHGQGYLGQLKSLTPELVDDVDIINGPFSAEYGDFSGLGVVHIRLKERMQDRLTLRFQGGSFDTFRTFAAYSPHWKDTDSFLAFEDSRTNGPFLNPLDYRRDNLTANITRHLNSHRSVSLKFNAARNLFDSSGQLPLDQIAEGNLRRLGSVDPYDGGQNHSATVATYFKQDFNSGDTLRADGFVSRSLFDLWSNFTFYLNDPIHGDEIQQHDSRLQEGANLQWLHPWKLGSSNALLTVGANFHDNQINVGLLHTEQRAVLDAVTSADAHVTNVAWYAQQGFDLSRYRLHLDVGLRFDVFRFDVANRLGGNDSGLATSGKLQPKANIIWTPTRRTPIALHASYGRGISSEDARGVVQYPNGPKVATTDFYQLGASTAWKRFSFSNDFFLINRSNEQVYIPDDGSIEFKGPSRSYGWESKASLQLTTHLNFNAGVTQVSNAFYLGTFPREYVDSAPHTVANSGLTIADWKGFYSSVRYRHISGYILDGVETDVRGTGADVVDWSLTKRLRHGLDFNFAVDNLTNHRYYETQNYFESRYRPNDPAVFRTHATPGYSRGFTIGLTYRFE